jgi:outer membrane receptor protein involved in Fe transport
MAQLNITMRNILLAGASLGATLCLAGMAAAQPGDSPAEDGRVAAALPDAGDIVVTARRRAEQLQDVPLAITAFAAETIERDGIRATEDVARRTPGLTFDIGGFPNDTRPALRGMQAERGRPSVAVLLDGQDLSGENISIAGGTAALNMSLFDLERIEVVKGPQSTLYGRNAFAGAINYVSKKPGFTLGGRLAAEAGSFGTKGVEGSLNVPLVDDRLAVRFNAAWRHQGGAYTNPVTGDELAESDTKGFGVAGLWRPSPDLEVVARYMRSEMDTSDLPTAFIGANVRLVAPGARYSPVPGPPPSIPCPSDVSGLTPAQQGQCTRGTYVGKISARERDIQMGLNPLTGKPPFGLKMDQDMASADVSWNAGFANLFYRFGYLRNSSEIDQDGDFSSFPAQPGPVLSLSALQDLTYDNEHFDHELRASRDFGRLSLLVGGQRFAEDSSLINSAQFWLRNPASPLAGPPFNLATAPSGSFAFPTVTARETRYWAIFGSLSWRATDRLTLDLDARWNRDRITYHIPGWRNQDVTLSRLRPVCLPQFPNGTQFNPQNPAGSPPPGVVVACPQEGLVSSDVVTPRATISWKATEDHLLYVSYAKGFKPGGFNTNEIVDLANQKYRPEKVNAYEIGVKTQWLDRRITWNADFYYNDYTDQQIGVQLSNTTPTGQVVTTAGIVNAGQVEIFGFETELDFRVTDMLRFMAGYAFTNSEFKEYIQGPPPGSPNSAFEQCGVPIGQTSSDQNRAEAGNICADFSGNKVGKSPKHALNFEAELRMPFGDSNAWFVGANALYRSKRFTDESNLAYLPDYWRVGLRAGVDIGRFSVLAFVNNLLDDRTIETSQRNIDFGRPEGFAPGRAFIAYLPQPRTWGVRGSFRF